MVQGFLDQGKLRKVDLTLEKGKLESLEVLDVFLERVDDQRVENEVHSRFLKILSFLRKMKKRVFLGNLMKSGKNEIFEKKWGFWNFREKCKNEKKL